jgi:hypothetical protein
MTHPTPSPSALNEFLQELARERFPGVKLFQATSRGRAEGIEDGDTVIYVRANAAGMEGKVIALMDQDGQIVFGRATFDEDGRIRVGDATYPRHMARGIVLAAFRLLDGTAQR